MKNKLMILFGLLLISMFSYGQKDTIVNIKLYQDKIEYPYSASESRKSIISENMNKLRQWMSKEEVIELLTLPDEINPTYSPSKASKEIIGFSMVYLLKRKMERGSVNEKDEQLIRIYFNNDGILTSAYSIGIDDFNEIKKKQYKK